jgi:hypothetical protein
VKFSYGCTDGGSGVASCSGGLVGAGGVVTPVASGATLDTSTPGTRTFRVLAVDNIGNQSSTTVTYSVSYRVCALPSFGPAHKWATVNVALCTPSGQNLSVAGIVLTATVVDGSVPAKPLGNANPGNRFVFVPYLRFYDYLLDATALGAGNHTLTFTIAGDPMPHTVSFVLG